jgi:uncharacterized protein YihD (DUF1040 family)
MRDPDRIRYVLEQIRRAWHKEPDQRLGQFLINTTRDEDGHVDLNRLWNIEDEDLVGRFPS